LKKKNAERFKDRYAVDRLSGGASPLLMAEHRHVYSRISEDSTANGLARPGVAPPVDRLLDR